MGSKLKKAHKTHGLAQTAGVPYRPGENGERSGDEQRDPVLRDFTELCTLVPDSHERATLLSASDELEAAWSRGERLPLLRARRAALRQLLRSRR